MIFKPELSLTENNLTNESLFEQYYPNEAYPEPNISLNDYRFSAKNPNYLILQ